MATARLAIDDRLYTYLLSSQPREHEELQALRARTRTVPESYMQIAPEQGHFLAFLVRLTGARRILEVGTFTGYSALAMALALPPDGKVITCDLSEAWAGMGRLHWERSGVADRIEVRIGPALDTLERLERERAEPFDLVFIDADKEAYDSYYEIALRLARPGGLIIIDNMFRRGRVADLNDTDPDPLAVRKLNAKIAGDERVDSVMLPIGDGMTLVRRR